MDSQDDFTTVLAQARRGERAALLQLIRVYEPALRRAAWLRLGAALRPHLDVDDMVQSVHQDFLEGLRRDQFHFTTPQQLRSLSRTLLSRRIARQWRQVRAQQRLADQDPGGAEPALVAPRETEPARLAEFNDEIQHLLKTLTAADRSLIELRLQGYSTAEAARALRLDGDVLRVRLSRLRRHMGEPPPASAADSA